MVKLNFKVFVTSSYSVINWKLKENRLYLHNKISSNIAYKYFQNLYVTKLWQAVAYGYKHFVQWANLLLDRLLQMQ